MWLTAQLAPDFKTIADFRKDNGPAIRKVCREFIVLCRKLDLLSMASVAIDGSKFKAVNARDTTEQITAILALGGGQNRRRRRDLPPPLGFGTPWAKRRPTKMPSLPPL